MRRLVYGLMVGLALSFAATATSEVTLNPDDVKFAGDGYKVIVVDGESAKKKAMECKCHTLIFPDEKIVIILAVEELCI